MDGTSSVSTPALRFEAIFTGACGSLDEKNGVIYEKKTVSGDSSAIPLVRGRGIVEGYTPRQLLALISYPDIRPSWDPRTDNAQLLERYSQFEVRFYTVQK